MRWPPLPCRPPPARLHNRAGAGPAPLPTDVYPAWPPHATTWPNATSPSCPTRPTPSRKTPCSPGSPPSRASWSAPHRHRQDAHRPGRPVRGPAHRHRRLLHHAAHRPDRAEVPRDAGVAPSAGASTPTTSAWSPATAASIPTPASSSSSPRSCSIACSHPEGFDFSHVSAVVMDEFHNFADLRARHRLGAVARHAAASTFGCCCCRPRSATPPSSSPGWSAATAASWSWSRARNARCR